jgi:hypothetical protein
MDQKIMLVGIVAIVVILLAVLMLMLPPEVKPEEPKEVPNDFSIELRTGATHAEWGSSYVTIDSTGEAALTVYEGDLTPDGPQYQATCTKTLSQEELKTIYNAVLDNNFFELEESYENNDFMDGSTSSITVTADGKNHRVSTYFVEVSEFDNIWEASYGLALSKCGGLSELDDEIEKQKCEEVFEACSSDSEYFGRSCDDWEDICYEVGFEWGSDK